MKKIIFLFMFTARVIAVLPNHDHCQLIKCKFEARTPTVQHIPLKAIASLNWSGYAAFTSFKHPESDVVTQVQGCWVVPTLSKTKDDTFSFIWVGMDGFFQISPTVEQIGTAQIWTEDGQQNFAWFEMFPNGLFEFVGFPVNEGDCIGAEVKFVGDDQFKLLIVNYTEKVKAIAPAKLTTSSVALRDSAQWIVEAPSSGSSILPLADFNKVCFSHCRATIDQISGSICSKAWKHDAITMVTPSGKVKSFPSGLSHCGESFSLTWEHQ